jgi:probable HAF family extracellular repeat protein
MKTKILRNLFLTLAVGWAAVLLPVNAGAGPTSKAALLASRIGRTRGGVERADSLHNTRAARNFVDATNGAAAKAASQSYPHFRLIDLGTLGGDNAFTVVASKMLNNRGQNAAQASTGVPDPFDPEFWLQDGTIWHAILSTGNGIVYDLGGIDGNQSVPVWLAENGLIAGLGENGLFDDVGGFPQVRALLWDKHHILYDLGTLGGNTSQGESVNSRGQVVGQAANAIDEDPDVATFFNAGIPAGQQVRAFLWQRGRMSDLGTLGGNDAEATAINDAGSIAGFSATDIAINDTTGLPTVHAFFWRNGRMIDVGSLGGSLSTTGSVFSYGPWGHILNSSGQVAGTSTLPGDESWHAFIWRKNKMTEIGTFGGDNSEAFFMSDKGEVLGRAEVSLDPFVRHAFLWENNQTTDLGAPAPCTRSSAISINSAGQIVGGTGACTDDPADPLYFSTFYTEKGNVPVDLNSLITPLSDIHLEDATYINDRGEISAGGVASDGTEHAVLLVPTVD